MRGEPLRRSEPAGGPKRTPLAGTHLAVNKCSGGSWGIAAFPGEETSLDADRFDCMTRSLGAETSRRGIAKALAGAALAGVAAPLGLSALDAYAKNCNGKGGKCKKNGDCCKGLKCKNNGKCKYKNSCGGKKGQYCKKNKDCCSGLKCKGKKCK